MDHLKNPLDYMAKRFFVVANMLRKGKYGPDSNVIVSPFATSVIATMMYCAADGRTLTQLENILRFQTLFDGEAHKKNILTAFRQALQPCNKLSGRTKMDPAEEAKKGHVFQLTIANHMFLQVGAHLKPGFLENMKKQLNVDITEIDFCGELDGMKEMYKWIENVCGFVDYNNIPPIVINQSSEGHRLATISVAYFRGAWRTPFDPKLTTRGQFFPDSGGPPKEVDIMTTFGKFPYCEDLVDGVKYIEIPYMGNAASLLITMPMTKSIAEFAKTMSIKLLHNIRSRKRMKMVRIRLPRFHFQCTYDLQEFFGLMDFANGLDSEGHASLGNMTEDKDFQINEGSLTYAIEVSEAGSFVLNEHKPVTPDPPPITTAPITLNSVEVTEEPTEQTALSKILTKLRPTRSLSNHAGAATTKRTSLKRSLSESEEEEVFEANRPFLIACRHNKSSAILFSGCLMLP